MFEKIRKQIFWDQVYDAEWKSIRLESSVARIFRETNEIKPLNWSVWSPLIEGCRAEWKKNGKLLGMTPERSVFGALDQMFGLLYKECKNSRRLDHIWSEIARLLWEFAPYENERGQYVDKATFLVSPWKELFSEYYKGVTKQR